MTSSCILTKPYQSAVQRKYAPTSEDSEMATLFQFFSYGIASVGRCLDCPTCNFPTSLVPVFYQKCCRFS